MQLITKLVPNNKFNIKCPVIMSPRGICVHNTANDACAEDEATYMIRNNNKVSFHYVVDNTQSIQTIPENRNAYHCGAEWGNYNLISIEICYSLSGGVLFDESEKNAAYLIAMLLHRYKWGVERVYTHKQQSGKYCPHRTLDMGWQRFLNMILHAYDDLFGNKVINNKPIVILKQDESEVLNNHQLWYRGHSQGIGWMEKVRDGQICGTTGHSLRLEAIQIDMDTLRKQSGYENSHINILAHIQNKGDIRYVDISSDTIIGTVGESLRIEALEFEVTGLPDEKQLQFRVHEAGKGWGTVGKTSNDMGVFRGSTGECRAIEAIQIFID